MKSEDYFIGSSQRESIANARGKISTQFMSQNLQKKNLSSKKDLEDGIKMGGYDVNVRNPITNRTDAKQPMARYSEFWLG